MNKTLIAIVIIAIATVASCHLSAKPNQQQLDAINAAPQFDPNLDQEWDDFKLKYRQGKSRYATPQIELERRSIWESNWRRIDQHNREYAQGLHTYTMGVNKFTDLTQEEFRSRYVGKLLPLNRRSPANVHIFEESLESLPASVDWRDKGVVTAVKIQQQCSSSWAFSATGSLEGQYAIKTGKRVSFSEQQLVDCANSYHENGCYGGTIDNAFQYIRDNGIESEEDYPYIAKNDTCHYDKSKIVTKIKSIIDIPSGNETQLQIAVALYGPISVGVNAMYLPGYRGGILDKTDCLSGMADLHQDVLVVGYGRAELSNLDYWIVKNSWGEAWGQDGYIFMSRNKNNQCGIADMASFPVLA